ncbi:MAG TPA: hypothetical protein VFE62_05835 [Gemmataceae bacterium]|nr:hypothetical protein [Gemmataceae bacterium]
MTRLRRLVAVSALLGLAVWVSSSLQGQSGKKPAGVATPQIVPGKAVSQPAEPTDSRFASSAIQTYQPIKGDAYFAMPVQPKLEDVPVRPRDYLIMLSTAATQAGPSWVAGHQIAEGIVETAREGDRISLWTVNEPKATKNLSKEFRLAKGVAEGRLLREALKQYRERETPMGTTDLKNALTVAIESFDLDKDRQRIVLFLGDGLSTFNPLTEADRQAIARKMVEKKIAFFPVPLGSQMNPTNLHGLASATGGAVLRTRVDEEKLVDAMKRYEQAFAAPVLYSANLQLPAEMVDVCPTVLPPLRGDTPTLVVGRMKKVNKSIDYTITGTVAGKRGQVAIKANEVVLPHNLENYFLVGMIEQWAKAKETPAILRADRALTIAYEQTRLQHLEYLEGAQMALEDGKLDAAHRLFKQVQTLAPDDGQAAAGLNIVDRLKDGTLTKDKIRKELEKRVKADRLKVVNGKPQWERVDFVRIAQEEKQPDKKQPNVNPKEPGVIGPENLLKEARDRQAVEEQKVGQAVDEAIQQANRNLRADPDGTLDNLRNLLNRVKDHPDLGARVRDALSTRLQTSLRDSAIQVQRMKLNKQNEVQAAAVTQANIVREQERKTFEDRVDAQFRLYKNLMTQARFEIRTANEITNAMIQIQDEARSKGFSVPPATKAMYDIALAANPLQQHNSLIRQRESKWLAVLMQVEKSHIPQPDEPGIVFPPLATWKALIKARKDKFDVRSLPDDEAGRKEATEIYRLLQQPIDTKGLQEKVKLKTALEYFGDRFGGKLPILIDKESFTTELGADAPDPYEEEVSLPPVPSKMVMNTALRLVLAQVGKGQATYLIRRNFIEITTIKHYLEDKVIRIYPVGDLVMPISGGQMGMLGSIGGGLGGMMGLGGMAGMSGMMMGGMPGMMMGGMPGMMMGGMGGMGMMMGGMGGMSMMGMGGMMMGGMGGMGSFQGGSFQSSFNGSLGAMGATQAAGLISLVTRIVDPGNWNRPPLTNQFAMLGMGMFPMMFPNPGMIGMVGMVGMMGNAGMIGAGPPPDPNMNADPQTSNSIDFFPPTLALIVRAPSRMHTSITGGIVGGRAKRLEAAASLEKEMKEIAIAKANGKDPKIAVAAGQGFDNDPRVAIKNKERIDPEKVWNDAFAKGGVNPALVVATADFLFEEGQFKHAAEFLKANLRQGVVVRPWVFEALAVALEASGGDPEEIRRARLSGIALDPNDAQGFMSAARAMADRGQFDRALSFCRQAAQLEPNDYHPYEVALAYAENAKDSASMEWAVGQLVSQDWPVDNAIIQRAAEKRLRSLSETLKSENRAKEANQLESALQRLNQRDIMVQLVWDNPAGALSELELQVKEPCGSVCSLAQKQSPGGGILLGYNLTDKEPNCQYVAAQAFPGEYQITVSRVYGQPLGNRARLIITQNAGTKNQSRRIEIIRLDNNLPIKLNLKEGRRTDLASVAPAAQQRHQKQASATNERGAFHDLRAVANPNSYFGATMSSSGGAGAPNILPSALAAKDSQNKMAPIVQNAVNPTNGGVAMTTQVRMSADQRSMDMVIRPFFEMGNRGNRPAVNLSAIPGGGN